MTWLTRDRFSSEHVLKQDGGQCDVKRVRYIRTHSPQDFNSSTNCVSSLVSGKKLLVSNESTVWSALHLDTDELFDCRLHRAEHLYKSVFNGLSHLMSAAVVCVYLYCVFRRIVFPSLGLCLQLEP